MFTAMPVMSSARMMLMALSAVALLAVGPSRIGWSQQAQTQAQKCSPSNRGMARMESARIALLNARRQRVVFESLIADDDLERASGFQHICPEVIARTPILFRYRAPVSTRFHMHNVKAPLEIGFFDGDGVLFQSMLMHPYADGAEILYGPMQEFQYALEARPGFFREKGLSAGSSRLLIEALP